MAARCPAQDDNDLSKMDIEHLMNVKVSTVSRVKESQDRTPGSVYVYTREQIKQRGFHSLRELLQVTPGFTVAHRDLQYVAGIRGLNSNDNEKISLLVNGQNFSGGQEPDFLNGPINLDNVERVEVVVGPSSLFQPANTLAATINVITRDIEGSEAILGAGSALKYSATFMTGHTNRQNQYSGLSITTLQQKGFNAWNSVFRPTEAGRDISGNIDQPSFFAVGKFKSSAWDFQFVGHRIQHPELDIDQGSSLNDGIYVDEFYSLQAKREVPLSLNLVSQATFSETLRQQSRIDQGANINALNITGKAWVSQGEWSLRYEPRHGNVMQAGVQAAYEYNFDTQYRLGDASGVVGPPVTLVDEDTKSLGFYLDDIQPVSKTVTLVAGGRIDNSNRLNGNRWFPGYRFGIIDSVTPTWTSKLLYNRAVRMPSPVAGVDTAWGIGKPAAPSWAQLASPPSDPEALGTIEWQNILHLPRQRIALTLYHQDLNDYISWIGPWTNVGNFKGNGAELSVLATLTPRVDGWISASLNDSKLKPFDAFNTTTGNMENQHLVINPDDRILASPMYVVNAGLTCRVSPDVTFSPTFRYFTKEPGFDLAHSQYVTINDRSYFDASLQWKNPFKSKDMDLSLTVTNLFNNRAQVAGQWIKDTYSPEGRVFTASLDWKF